jgi:hypothetical protein
MTGAPPDFTALLQEIEPVIRGVVRQKLRVQFHRTDTTETQDALDLVAQVLADLTGRLRSGAVRAESAREYAAVAAYHACAEHFRATRAPRYRLQLKLRYFLTHHPDFAVWEDSTGTRICGLASWASRRQSVSSERIEEARRNSASILGDAAPRKEVAEMRPADWTAPMRALFRALDGPLPLIDVYGIVAAMVLRDGDAAAVEAVEQADRSPSPEEQTAAKELVTAIWRTILDLPLHWRRAFLLNPPRGLDIEEFALRGVATVETLGTAVALTGAEFDMLRAAVIVDPGPDVRNSPSNAVERFAALWRHLPLRDSVIARMYGEDAQYIINLRRLARDRLRSDLAPPCPQP